MFIKMILASLLLTISVPNLSSQNVNLSNTIEPTESINKEIEKTQYSYYTIDIDTYETIIQETYAEIETTDKLKHEILNDILIDNEVIIDDVIFNDFRITTGVGYLDMNRPLDYLGSGFESATLEAIKNTFLMNYDIHELVLTINNEVYTSGHISFQ